MSPAYVDSSALVKLIIDEVDTDAMRAYAASATALTASILATVEVARAVGRVAPESTGVVVALFETLNVLAFDARIAARAAGMGPSGLRTLDAIHLATALELGDELTAFVTYDDRLADAARDLGLPVVSPGGRDAIAGSSS